MMTICLPGFTKVIAPGRDPLLSHQAFAARTAPHVNGRPLFIQATEAHQILFLP